MQVGGLIGKSRSVVSSAAHIVCKSILVICRWMDATRSTVVMLRYISAPAVKKVWERTSAKCKKTQGDMSHCRQPSVPRWLRHYTQCSVTSYYHRSTLTSLMHSTV